MNPENKDSKENLKDKVDEGKEHIKKKHPFIVGSSWGVLVSLIILIVMYPWGRGNFEGESAYFILYMIFVLPGVTIGCGVINVFLDEFCKEK